MNNFNKSFSTLLFFLLLPLLLMLNFHVFVVFAQQNDSNTDDQFGVKKIYPTKVGGREWFMNMADPKNDSSVKFTFSTPITKQDDGSWRINNDKIRINVDSFNKLHKWKNVEITGYVKINSVIKSHNHIIPDIDWVSRTDIHNENYPCYGLALHGGIHPDGSVGWKKEIWFTGGYTREKSIPQVTDSITNRWIGWKTIVYNIHNDSAVKMESYLDNSNSNHWVKVFDMIDNGGWFADNSDKIFYSANCGRSKDYIILNSGSIVTFRADNIDMDFKKFSIREIAPP